MNRIAVLGSTGSIGTSCLDVVRAGQDRLAIFALAAHHNWQTLGKQAWEFRPRIVALGDVALRNELPAEAFPPETEVLFGPDAVAGLAARDEVDTVVAAIVGAAGLRGTWAAVQSGKRVALANKESLVVAGSLVIEAAERHQAELLPVDSEHSGVFQCLRSGRRDEVRRVVLTASGGPFRGWSRDQLTRVTPEMALQHPTWVMGRKITVDSATLMNKALELIEAKWLFKLTADELEVVVHPQSIVHAMVEFVDGSVIAQLSPPDMKLPIQYALTYPERVEGIASRTDWQTGCQLSFEPPDLEAFPALQLGREVIRRGGTCGAVLNAANEVAVSRFLAGELKFTDIPRACRGVLESHHFDPNPSLDQLVSMDAWAREEASRWQNSI